jgi:hypothetical protein
MQSELHPGREHSGAEAAGSTNDKGDALPNDEFAKAATGKLEGGRRAPKGGRS